MTKPHSSHAVVFGPLKSKALGSFLGVNVAPTPRLDCDPTCVFCQTGSADTVPVLLRGGQLPSPGIVVTSAARKIMALSKAAEKIECIGLAGNLDPTLHPDLILIAENVRELRHKWFPRAAYCLLVDEPQGNAPNLRHAMSLFDKILLRFEWGSAKTFTAMTGRDSEGFKRTVDLLSGVDRLVVQARFVQGKVDNSTDAEVRGWIKKVEELRPDQVQVATVDGNRKGVVLKPIPAARLAAIAQEVQERTGIKATVMGGELLAV
jgi:wyosine [tRNA(Phe)-imidazoG37] synthetase (radical SAM superfamily)